MSFCYIIIKNKNFLNKLDKKQLADSAIKTSYLFLGCFIATIIYLCYCNSSGVVSNIMNSSILSLLVSVIGIIGTIKYFLFLKINILSSLNLFSRFLIVFLVYPPGQVVLYAKRIYNTEYEIHMFEPKLAEIKAMKNGMYEIPEGYDGIKSINVAVPADYSSIYYYHKWIVSENDRILDIGNTVYIDKPTSVIYGNSPMLTIDGNSHEIDFTQICDDNNYDITISLGEKFDVTCSEEDCAIGLDTFTVFIPENKTGKNRSLTVYINHKMRGTSIIYKCVTTFTQKSL